MEDHTHWKAFRYSPEQITLGETGEKGSLEERYEALREEADNLRSQLEVMANLAIRCALGEVSIEELWGLIEGGKAVSHAPSLGYPKARESVVYYIQMPHGRVKIGRTVNITNRLQTFALTPRSLLAVEAGGADVEHLRHEQFADERVGRSELFDASDRLVAHIASVRAASDDTPYVRAATINGCNPAWQKAS